jgi:hypothetical protein
MNAFTREEIDQGLRAVANREVYDALASDILRRARQSGDELDDEELEFVVSIQAIKLVRHLHTMTAEFFPPEEMERLIDEEFERLKDPETKAASEDEVVLAVIERMAREFTKYFGRGV